MKAMVMFDLPTTEKGQRRAYVHFRSRLLKWGFEQYQESVYVKECDDEWHVKTVCRMVGGMAPAEGKVMVCSFSDKQWSNTLQYENGERVEEPCAPKQMVMML